MNERGCARRLNRRHIRAVQRKFCYGLQHLCSLNLIKYIHYIFQMSVARSLAYIAPSHYCMYVTLRPMQLYAQTIIRTVFSVSSLFEPYSGMVALKKMGQIYSSYTYFHQFHFGREKILLLINQIDLNHKRPKFDKYTFKSVILFLSTAPTSTFSF